MIMDSMLNNNGRSEEVQSSLLKPQQPKDNPYEMTVGGKIGDLIVNFGSIDIVLGEVDR